MRVYYIDHPVIGQLALTAEEMSVIVKHHWTGPDDGGRVHHWNQ